MIWRNKLVNIYRSNIGPKASNSRKYRWILQSVLFTTAGLGVAYTINKSRKNSKPTDLQTDYFTPYQITRRVINDPNHFIIELTPTVAQKTNIWSQLAKGQIWSIEVKQPEIMVARNYTPLPLRFVDGESDDLEVINKNDTENSNDGKLVLFIKNYDQGEVSKWIANLPLNHTIEIRGPFVEYSLSEQVNNVNFFAAGTAIVGPLQLLLNPYSNYSSYPKLNIFYSCGNIQKELGPISNILFNRLGQNTSMINMNLFEDSKNQNIAKNIRKFSSLIPVPSNSPDNSSVSLVCGPDRYIETIAGKRYDLSQGPVKGLLSEKGWSSRNVYKLS